MWYLTIDKDNRDFWVLHFAQVSTQSKSSDKSVSWDYETQSLNKYIIFLPVLLSFDQ